MIDVLHIIRNEIDSLPALKNYHEGVPAYDEAIGLAKDKVFSAIEDIILYVETDDSDEEDEEDDENV